MGEEVEEVDARDFVKLLKPKLAKCGATRVPRTPAEPGYRTARRVSPLPSSCSAERVALLGSHLLGLPTQTTNCPHNVRQEPSRSDARQTQDTLLRCTQRQFHRDTQPAVAIPSSFALPPSQRLSPRAPITHNASPTVLRLQFSERNVVSTASLGLDPRSTSQLRSRIGCLQACRAGLLWSSSCPPGQAGPLRANWYRNLTLSNLLVCQVLRS